LRRFRKRKKKKVNAGANSVERRRATQKRRGKGSEFERKGENSRRSGEVKSFSFFSPTSHLPPIPSSNPNFLLLSPH